VEVEPVEVAAAIDFLTDRDRLGSSRWKAVVDELRSHPDGPLARALSTPLMVDLARSSYTDPAADPAELCDTDRFPDRESVEVHLLDTYLPTAYAERPGQPDHGNGPAAIHRYDSEQAQRWLRFLAAHLDRTGSRDIAWWRLERTLPRWGRGLVLGLAPAFLFAATGLVGGGLRIALIYGLAFALGGVVAQAFGRIKPPMSVEPRFGAGRFSVRFTVGAAIGIAMGLAKALPTTAVVALAFVIGLAVGSYAWLDRPVDVRRVSSPHTVLSGDRLAGLLFSATLAVSLGVFYGLAYAFTDPDRALIVFDGTVDLGMGIAAALAGAVLGQLMLGRWGSIAYGAACAVIGGQAFALIDEPYTAPLTGVLFGLAVGLAVFSSRAWGAFTITRLWLAARGRLPLRLMRFLDDAHRRGVLRQVGAVYQFRHARLQDRLAALK
ncbi:MAG: AfsR family transcriptional regulator, partial [Actinomycetes bacterium]